MVRAAPLAPDARRASIIAATLPLLRLHGRAVTTSQIAMAAGVAEGTLFRVFPDKDSLVDAAIQSAFDPEPFERDLENIDRSLGMREQLIAVAEVLQRRIGQIWQLIAVLGLSTPLSPDKTKNTADDSRLRQQLATFFEPFRGEIRVDPEQAARLLRALSFAGTHPRMTDQPLTAHELVSLLLDGIRAREEEA